MKLDNVVNLDGELSVRDIIQNLANSQNEITDITVTTTRKGNKSRIRYNRQIPVVVAMHMALAQHHGTSTIDQMLHMAPPAEDEGKA